MTVFDELVIEFVKLIPPNRDMPLVGCLGSDKPWAVRFRTIMAAYGMSIAGEVLLAAAKAHAAAGDGR